MKILPYEKEYREDILRLWNTGGVRESYAPLTAEELDKLLLEHPYFSEDTAFILEDNGEILGFICGTGAQDLPGGSERGYMSCILLDDKVNTDEASDLLMDTLEGCFRERGKKECLYHFFNPVKLPWVIPGTNGAQHNNAPGVAQDSILYSRMSKRGYKSVDVEGAMYMDLSDYTVPSGQEEMLLKAADEGYNIDWYDASKHTGLKEMVDSIGNAEWSATIPQYASEINMLVALKGNEVVGFTGPVYPEKTGRGFFAGIAVSAAHERHGLGSLLFYRLCEEEKEHGAAYMSLFTGVDGHAQKIYKSVGFEVKRIFCAMKKNL